MIMTGEHLRSARKLKKWNQGQAALRLGVSQPYLSLLERGERRVPEKLARQAAGVYGLPATTLPVEADWSSIEPADEHILASELASLGYPGLSYLKRRRRKNPATVLLRALSASNLDSRLIETLPWVIWNYPEMDWQWLINIAKVNDLQNRLGFVTAVARRLAETLGEDDKATLLGQREMELAKSRLAREDTLCHESLTEPEKRWLRKHRSKEAKRWGLLTDLSLEHLSYAA
jgi:transcriptional regulator with XRE-family HTH domain